MITIRPTGMVWLSLDIWNNELSCRSDRHAHAFHFGDTVTSLEFWTAVFSPRLWHSHKPPSTHIAPDRRAVPPNETSSSLLWTRRWSLIMTTGSCFVCGTNLCSSCKSVSYCNKEHQKTVRSKYYTQCHLHVPKYSSHTPSLPCCICRTGNYTKNTALRWRQPVPTHLMPSFLPWMKPSLVSLRFLGSWSKTIWPHGRKLTKPYGSSNQRVLWESYTFINGESMGRNFPIASASCMMTTFWSTNCL